MLIEGSSAVDAAAAGAEGAVGAVGLMGAVVGAMELSEASLSKEGRVDRRKAYPRLVPMAASDAVAAAAGSASAS